MNDRLKILDCSRKAILALPSPALHLWMCYYMNEDDAQESYMSLDEVESQVDARMSRRTIITWTQWLVSKGWLVDTGKTAADKFLQRGKTATRGAYQIRVYRVDDPTSAKSALVNTSVNKDNFTSAKPAPVQIAHKVSCSSSGSDSLSSSNPPSASDSESAAAPRGGREKVKSEDQNLKPKPKTKTRHAAAGTPWPEGFDYKWDNVQRTNWLKDHDGSEESRKERERWERQLAISSRVGPMTTAAASPPPAPISQSERQTFDDFPVD